jgi:hypothetical protein
MQTLNRLFSVRFPADSSQTAKFVVLISVFTVSLSNCDFFRHACATRGWNEDCTDKQLNNHAHLIFGAQRMRRCRVSTSSVAQFHLFKSFRSDCIDQVVLFR